MTEGLKKRLAGILFAILPLSVGCMFFIPGLFFLKSMIEAIFINKRPIELPFVFITTFALLIGAILLLLALKFIRGKDDAISISSPVLVFASLFFIVIATTAAILGIVFHQIPNSRMFGQAVGGGYVIGFGGLWYVFKQKKSKTNHL